MGLELHPKIRIIRDDKRETCGIAGPEKKHISITTELWLVKILN